ncbi:MAG TPA: hypothetical protein VNH40_12180, partial [Gaiellaceae bacterium]|nr:hypothetical protein [Gaiellaceae bacterium]
PPPRQPLLVGLDDDTLKWTSRPLAVVRRQLALGARAVRVWVPWHGEALPGAVRREELARAEQAAQRIRVVLAVFGFARATPTTAAAQARFCGYARAVLALVPDSRAVVVWNEANSRTYWQGTPADYERLLASCYDSLHALDPGITVLDSTASGHAPAAFLQALGTAYRASGRGAPLVDAFGHNPYPKTSEEQPLATHPPGFLGEGDYPRLVSALERAFGGTAQRSRNVWYLEDGFQSTAPQRIVARYHGRENAPTVTPTVQAEHLRTAMLMAACQPSVRAFFNFELVDERRLAGWQSGLYWSDSTPKPAAVAFAAAASLVRTGDVWCDSSTKP